MSITPEALAAEFSLPTAATRLDFLSRRDNGDTALNTVCDLAEGQEFEGLVHVELGVGVLERGPVVVVVTDGVERGVAVVAAAEEIESGSGRGQLELRSQDLGHEHHP